MTPVPIGNPNLPYIITACALLWGLCIGLGAYVVLRKLAEFKPEQREYKVVVPLLFRVFLPFAKRLQWVTKRAEFAGACERTSTKLVQAGLDQVFSPQEFVGLRLMYAVVFLPVAFALFGLGLKVFYLLGVTFLFLALGYPPFWLFSQVRKRHRSIQRALPNVLDLLTLSVEAGRDFLSALRDILQNREHDPLSEELERVFREVQLGKQRRQALRAMAERVRQPDLDSVVETLVQADELGVSIGQILRILSDQMRAKRFAHAEKLANESPVKLLFPLFLFIFPAVILVMLGPILLRSLERFM